MGYTVYMHVNKTNGKRYVGQTRMNPKRRWREGLGYQTQVFFHAIKKYTWDGFDHIIVATDLSSEEADKLECELIEKYNTMNPDYGYNMVGGGNSKKTISEETRKRIGEGNRGKFVSEETRKRLSAAGIGRKMSPESIQKTVEAHKRKVLQIKDGVVVKVWDSIVEAATELNADKSNIVKVCRGKQKSAYGYTWEYADEEEVA